MDADAPEAELASAVPLVDALRVVVQQQQTVGVRVDHLHHQLQPLVLEVMAELLLKLCQV